MPEAEKFTALGAGNGFPACLYDGLEDDTEHDLSKVSNIFYNLHKMTVENVENVPEVLVTMIGDFVFPVPTIGLEPKERVCALQEATTEWKTGVVTGYKEGENDSQRSGRIRVRPLKLVDSKHHILVDIFLTNYNVITEFYEIETVYSSNPLGLYDGIYEYYFKHEIDCGGVTLYGGSVDFLNLGVEPAGPIPRVTGFEFYTYPS